MKGHNFELRRDIRVGTVGLMKFVILAPPRFPTHLFWLVQKYRDGLSSGNRVELKEDVCVPAAEALALALSLAAMRYM